MPSQSIVVHRPAGGNGIGELLHSAIGHQFAGQHRSGCAGGTRRSGRPCGAGSTRGTGRSCCACKTSSSCCTCWTGGTHLAIATRCAGGTCGSHLSVTACRTGSARRPHRTGRAGSANTRTCGSGGTGRPCWTGRPSNGGTAGTGRLAASVAARLVLINRCIHRFCSLSSPIDSRLAACCNAAK